MKLSQNKPTGLSNPLIAKDTEMPEGLFCDGFIAQHLFLTIQSNSKGGIAFFFLRCRLVIPDITGSPCHPVPRDIMPLHHSRSHFFSFGEPMLNLRPITGNHIPIPIKAILRRSLISPIPLIILIHINKSISFPHLPRTK